MLQAKPRPITLQLHLNKTDMYMFFSLYLKTIRKCSGYQYATRVIAQHILNEPHCVEIAFTTEKIEVGLVLSPKQEFSWLFEITWPFLYSKTPKTSLRAFFRRLKANYSTKAAAELTILLDQTKEGLCKSR